MFVFLFPWSFINREHSPASQLHFRPVSHSGLSYTTHHQAFVGLKRSVYTSVAEPKRESTRSQRADRPPSLHSLFLHFVLLCYLSADEVWNRSAPALDSCSFCLDNTFKQDIASRSNPRKSFIYAHRVAFACMLVTALVHWWEWLPVDSRWM